MSESSVRRHIKHQSAGWLVKARAQAISGLKDFDIDKFRTSARSKFFQLLTVYQSQTDQLVEMCISKGDLRTASSLIGRRTKLLESLGHALGELGQGGVTHNYNYRLSLSYSVTLAAINRALAGPEGKVWRDRVVAEMRKLENAPEPGETVDAESKEIGTDGTPLISALANTTGAAETATATAPASSVPTIVCLESFSDSKTLDRVS